MLLKTENSTARFEETFLPHFDAAYNLARWLTRDPSDAEDVVQEAYLRAFKFFNSYHGGDSRAWVLRIVRNTCFSWLQKNRSHEVAEIDEELTDESASDPESQAIENIERQTLRQLLEQLPAAFREVIVLRDIEGLSYKEIAAVTELPIGTVMSRIARARKQLQADAKILLKGETPCTAPK